MTKAVNEYSHIPINYKFSGKTDKVEKGQIAKCARLKPYLYETVFNDLDFDFAESYYEREPNDLHIAKSGGGCSSFIHGGYYGRNLDWLYDSQAEFIVRRPLYSASYNYVGVSGGIPYLTDDFVMSGEDSDYYKVVPFQIFDGINECGLVANFNVVPLDGDTNEDYIPPCHSEEVRRTIPALTLVRFILANFSSALDAYKYIRDYCIVKQSKALGRMGYGLHFMVHGTDSDLVFEFRNGRIFVQVLGRLVPRQMTNFRLQNITLNSGGWVYTPETQHDGLDAISANNITPHGSGLERWNLIHERIIRYSAEDFTKGDARELLSDLAYTRMYSTSPNPPEHFWFTEYVEDDLKVNSPVSDFEEAVNIAGQYFLNRERDDGKTWHTVHSSLYDIENKCLYLVTQEDDREMLFRM